MADPKNNASPPSGLVGADGRPLGVEPVGYEVGGAGMLMPPPDMILAEFERAAKAGWKPPIDFALSWSRTSIHFNKHREEIGLLKNRITQLEERIDKLTELGEVKP